MKHFFILALLCLASTFVHCGKVAETTQDGHKKIVMHEEAIIPTNTVTATVTETAVVTQTVHNTVHETPMPATNTYTLGQNEPLPVARDDRTLLRRVVTDIWLRNGTFIRHENKTSSALAKIALSSGAVISGIAASLWLMH